jgi:hypothetical protein
LRQSLTGKTEHESDAGKRPQAWQTEWKSRHVTH